MKRPASPVHRQPGGTMNRLRHALGRDERGQILVIVAGGMIALLAIAALALEGGTLLLNRRDAQNGADLASVAGTREVALKYVDTATVRVQSNVFAAVNKSLIANGCVAADGCTWTGEFADGSLTEPRRREQLRRRHPGQHGRGARHGRQAGRRGHRPRDRVQLLDGVHRGHVQGPRLDGELPGRRHAADRRLRLDQSGRQTTARRRRRTRRPATSSTSRRDRSTT